MYMFGHTSRRLRPRTGVPSAPTYRTSRPETIPGHGRWRATRAWDGRGPSRTRTPDRTFEAIEWRGAPPRGRPSAFFCVLIPVSPLRLNVATRFYSQKRVEVARRDPNN